MSKKSLGEILAIVSHDVMIALELFPLKKLNRILELQPLIRLETLNSPTLRRRIPSNAFSSLDIALFSRRVDIQTLSSVAPELSDKKSLLRLQLDPVVLEARRLAEGY